MKCSACQLIAHQNCIPLVNEKSQLACKPTYRDVGIRQYREQTTTHHHWVHRKLEKGKCKQCGKVSQRFLKWCRVVSPIGFCVHQECLRVNELNKSKNNKNKK